MTQSSTNNTTASSIARRLGLAKSTVSMALRDSPMISERTRKRVHRAAERMSYTPNGIARAVATGKTCVIGFLAKAISLELEHIGSTLNGAVDATDELGYFIKILRLSPNQPPDQIVRKCAERRVSGVICLNFDEPTLEELHQQFHRFGVPVAVVDSSFPHPWGIRVVSDDAGGIHQALDHLGQLGHRRIAYLGSTNKAGTYVQRREAFLTQMNQRGWNWGPPEQTAPAFHDYHDLPQVVGKLLIDGRRPTALTCFNDPVAMLAIRAATTMGLHVPRDLSIVGFSDLSVAGLATPPLTTIAQPHERMGETVARLLIDSIECSGDADGAGPVEKVLPTRLVVRGSTAPPLDQVRP